MIPKIYIINLHGSGDKDALVSPTASTPGRASEWLGDGGWGMVRTGWANCDGNPDGEMRAGMTWRDGRSKRGWGLGGVGWHHSPGAKGRHTAKMPIKALLDYFVMQVWRPGKPDTHFLCPGKNSRTVCGLTEKGRAVSRDVRPQHEV